jgi:hypothetical protein
MRSLHIALALILSLTVNLFAQNAKKVDPSGTWRWETNNNGVQQKHQLKLRLDKKGKVRATYDGMLDDIHSVEGKMIGDKLMLEFEVETANGDEFEAKYDATIKGDSATGKISLSSDEGEMDLDWDAKRTVELADVKGTWDLVLDIEGETREAALTVTEKSGKFSATYEDEMVGELRAREVEVKDNELVFKVNGSHDGTDFVANCAATPIGTKLNGSVSIELGDTTMDIPMKGTLLEANPIGTWNLSIQTDEGEMNPKLIVNVEGGKLDGVFQAGDLGDFETKRMKIDGEKIVFFMDGQLEGDDFESKVEAKMSGDRVKGVLFLEVSNEEMELPIAGKRMK